jgi:hypothetical protein
LLCKHLEETKWQNVRRKSCFAENEAKFEKTLNFLCDFCPFYRSF